MAKETLGIIYILLVLLAPNKYFEVYYVLLFSFIYLTQNIKFKFNRFEIVILSYISIIAALRVVTWGEIGDLKELIKITFLITTISFIRNDTIGLNHQKLYIGISIFTILNFISSVSLSFNLIKPLNQLIIEIYTSDSQRILYSYNNIRSTGLSPGVGQQGIMSFICFAFFLNQNKSNGKTFILVFISLLTLVLSQSKTAFIITVLYSVFHLRKNKFIFFIGTTILSYLIFVFRNTIEIYLREIYGLFRTLKFSSWSARIENWQELLTPMLEKPLSMIFGIGRSYFDSRNISSSVYDNDYVYLMTNYGIVGLLIFMLFTFYLFKNTFVNLRVVIFLLLVSSFSLNPFFDPKTFTFLYLIIYYLKRQYAKENMLDFN